MRLLTLFQLWKKAQSIFGFGSFLIESLTLTQFWVGPFYGLTLHAIATQSFLDKLPIMLTYAIPYMGGWTGCTPLVNGCVASRAYKLSFLLLALHKCVLRCVAALHTFCVAYFLFLCAPFLHALCFVRPFPALAVACLILGFPYNKC